MKFHSKVLSNNNFINQSMTSSTHSDFIWPLVLDNFFFLENESRSLGQEIAFVNSFLNSSWFSSLLEFFWIIYIYISSRQSSIFFYKNNTYVTFAKISWLKSIFWQRVNLLSLSAFANIFCRYFRWKFLVKQLQDEAAPRRNCVT